MEQPGVKADNAEISTTIPSKTGDSSEHVTGERSKNDLQDPPNQNDQTGSRNEETAAALTIAANLEDAGDTLQAPPSALSIRVSSASSSSNDSDGSRTPNGSHDTRVPEDLDETNAFGAQSIITDFAGSNGDVPESFIAKFDVQAVIDDGPQKLMFECKQADKRDRLEPDFRWIHLPANNMYWVEETINAVCRDFLGNAGGDDSASRVYQHLILRRDRWSANQHRGSNKALHSRYMKPAVFTSSIIVVSRSSMNSKLTSSKAAKQVDQLAGNTDPNRTDEQHTIIYMPYIHWESLVDGVSRKSIIRSIELDKLSTGTYLQERYLQTSITHKSPMHIRRTLDQYYYYQLKNTDERDSDQVVTRYAEGEFPAMDPPIIMVDQLWLFVLKDQTVITAFPPRYDREHEPESKTELLAAILHRLPQGYGPAIRTPWDLAAMIIDCASGFFFDTTRLPPQLHFVDAFTSAIGTVSDKQAVLFATFKTLVSDMDALRHERASSDEDLKRILDDQASMSTETRLTQEIQDILDELNSLVKVYKEQQTVIRLLGKEHNAILQSWQARFSFSKRRKSQQSNSTSEPGADDAEQPPAYFEPWAISDLSQAVESRRLEFEELRSQAGRVYDTLRHLLDLKQKQANLSEAWSSRTQAEESSKLSEEAIKQGRSIMLFTVVTIIFLPLSFFCSVFGMNTQELNGGTFGMGFVLPIMFCLSAPIIVSALLLAFNEGARDFVLRSFERAWRLIFSINRLSGLGLDSNSAARREEKRQKKKKNIHGKTIIPSRSCYRNALVELGYPFVEEGNSIVVLQALDKQHLDEVIKKSKEIDIAIRLISSIPAPPLLDLFENTSDRLTYLKIHYHYIDTGTLIAYNLPWEFDKEDDSHVVIKKWISERDRGILFDHTKRLRAARRAARTDTASSISAQSPDENEIKTTRPNNFNPVRTVGNWLRDHEDHPEPKTHLNLVDRLSISVASSDNDHPVRSTINPVHRFRQWRRARNVLEDDAELNVSPTSPKSPKGPGRRYTPKHMRNTEPEEEPEVVEIKPMRAS